jgi:hypothetical protein
MIDSALSRVRVPERYLGVWQRTLLTTTDGKHDASSRVYWLQTAQLFADLRIPRPAPQTPEQLVLQAGFAGVTEVTQSAAGDELCQWHRAIDFQPPRASADIGRMHFAHADYLLEDGLDYSYHEVWERLPDSLGRNWGTWLAAADGHQGCLLLAGDYFLFVASRAAPLHAGSSLAELLDDRSNCSQLLDCELSFGRHHRGVRPWQIELSTMPVRIGRALLPASISPDQPAQLCAPGNLTLLGHVPPEGGWQVCEQPLFPLTQEHL